MAEDQQTGFGAYVRSSYLLFPLVIIYNFLIFLREMIYSMGIEFITGLQLRLSGFEEFLNIVSLVGDPGLAYTLYFPIFFAFNWSIGIRFLATAVICDWLNMILKWYSFGHRPFWWIHETQQYKLQPDQPVPVINQTYLTCETGPGFPSGHAMFSAILWYVVLDSVYTQVMGPRPYFSRNIGAPNHGKLLYILWSGYWLMQALVIASRCYIAAHFPHQCLVGTYIGLVLVQMFYNFNSNHWWMHFSGKDLFYASVAIYVQAWLSHFFLNLIGLNLDWSVELAKKWCSNPNWIKIDTTPMYTLSRFGGAGVGLALGKETMSSMAARFSHCRPAEQVVRLLFGLATGYGARMIHHYLIAAFKRDLLLFYVSEYFLNAALTFTIISVGPLFSSFFCRPNEYR